MPFIAFRFVYASTFGNFNSAPGSVTAAPRPLTMAIMIGTAAEARAYGKAGARAADQAGQTALVTICCDRQSTPAANFLQKTGNLGII